MTIEVTKFENVEVVTFSDEEKLLRVYDDWDSQYLQAFSESGCNGIILSGIEADGVVTQIISVPEVRILQIDGGKFADIHELENAEYIEVLRIQLANNPRLYLSKLLNLKEYFSSVLLLESVASLPASLRDLRLDGYSESDIEPLEYLQNLESLQLVKCRNLKSLNGVSRFEKLTNLSIAYSPKLDNIEDLKGASRLECLEFDGCKSISSIEPIGSLTNLRKLFLNNLGDVDSLKPLMNLKQLEELLFIEETNVLDGSLSQLSKLPAIKKIWFQDRQHYDVTRDELADLIRRR